MESQVAVSLLPPCSFLFISLNVGVFLKDRSKQKLNAHSQNEADMSLWLWGWISFEGILCTKWGRWGLAVEFPVGTGSFKTQIKQGGNAQRMNMNWCWALLGLASFDKAHFLIACQLFTLFKYVSSDEHVNPETDTQMHTETHMCTRARGKDAHTSFTPCHSSAPGSSQLWEGPEQQGCWLDLALVKYS